MGRQFRDHKIISVFVLMAMVLPFASEAQQKERKKKKKGIQLPAPPPPDKNYIADYHKELTARIFGSRKFTTYGLHDKGFAEDLLYRPNTPFNIGVGFNYRILGINAGFNLPLINDTKERGRTRYLDIQSHFYGRRLLVDFYLQQYKGFYLSNPGIINGNNNDQVYIRPDLYTLNFGLVVQFIPNGRKFSFRGAFLQNEVQLQSAGSPIIGGSISDVAVRSDSSIIPVDIRYRGYFNDFDYNRSDVKSLAFNFGYGYTLVLPQHLFITAAGTAGVGINYSNLWMSQGNSTAAFGTDINATIRIGLGYNSRRYYAGMHYLGSVSASSTPIVYTRQQFGAGNFRISFAKRFTLKKKLFGFY